MIRFENTEVVGWEAAVRGMRNPMNSWEKSDSDYCETRSCTECPYFYRADNCYGQCMLNHDTHAILAEFTSGNGYIIGPNDHKLMMKLAGGGSVHAKYRRMITVYVDIIAPFYWWKEFDTYKVGTVANSCSTMHKIADKEFTLDDFSYEHLLTSMDLRAEDINVRVTPMQSLLTTIECLNSYRELYLKTKDKKYWYQLIQLLPTSYNQRRTVMMNYEVLAGLYYSRKDHKLDEWHQFCDWVEGLPYSEIIIGAEFV